MPYLNVAEVESALSVATSAPFSGFAQLITLPSLTSEGRQCHAIKIGNGSSPGRPGVLLLGGVHAREWGSADILVNLVERLVQAYQTGTGLMFGPRTFSASDIQTIVNTIDLIVFPQANPDGRHHSMTADAMWRKNRRVSPPNSAARPGVDINRNYDFLWDFSIYFNPVSSPASANPCDYQVYHGPSAFSEPETSNVGWIFENFPHVRSFIDIHSHGQSILYSWGHDEAQSADPSMNFRNAAYDGQRGLGGDAYKEYIPSIDRSTALDLASTLRSAIQAVRGTAYAVKSGFPISISGASDDYAYSRHFGDPTKAKVIAFTLEWGTEFQPPYGEMQNIMQEITCGLLAFCLNITENTMSWELTGNSGIIPATNFLGTTDNQPLAIRTNGSERLRIAPDGNIGIGTAAPSARLSVVAPGTSELAGSVRSATLLTSAGSLGTAAGNELALTTIGFLSGNNSSLGIRALRVANGSSWPSTAIGLGMDVDNTIRAGASLWLHANGGIGIGTSAPQGGKLGVAGNSQDFALRTENTGDGGAIAGVAKGLYPSIVGLALGAGAGVHGHAAQTTKSSIGVIGTVGGSDPYLIQPSLAGGIGVLGHSSGTPGTGVAGSSDSGTGVEGFTRSGVGAGVSGTISNANGAGVYGQNDAPPGHAGRFIGNVRVQGTLYTTGKGFRIDHPLDPANKYLSHSSIESPDMMNVYSGNITTDIGGSAVVVLPDYFEALNRDFKYQLTVIGEFAQAIVEREMEGNRFVVKTDRPNVKVSWQVAGVRKDPYAEAHRIRVEEEKSDTERGRYLHPELYQTTSTEPDARLPIGWIPSMLPGQRVDWPGAKDALIG